MTYIRRALFAVALVLLTVSALLLSTLITQDTNALRVGFVAALGALLLLLLWEYLARKRGTTAARMMRRTAEYVRVKVEQAFDQDVPKRQE